METEKSIKVVSIPPVYFFISIFLQFTVASIWPEMSLINLPYNLIFGIPVIIIGLYLIAKSHFILKKHNTTERFERTTALVNNSLYTYSRNPMYLGFLLVLVGLSFLLKNVVAFIFPILFFVVINSMFIPFEEEKMEKELGEKYLLYKNKVRRWI